MSSLPMIQGGGTEITGFTGTAQQTDTISAIVGHRYLIFVSSLNTTNDYATGIDIETQTSLLSNVYANWSANCKAIIGVATSTTITVYLYKSYQSLIWIDLDA